jgi:RNA-binding protein Musashi
VLNVAVEAVIMNDHTTGRARGFGFVEFADLVVAERVIKEKHHIDGRMVISSITIL